MSPDLLLGILAGIPLGAALLHLVQLALALRRRRRHVEPAALAVGGLITAEHLDCYGRRVIERFQVTECGFLGDGGAWYPPAASEPPAPPPPPPPPPNRMVKLGRAVFPDPPAGRPTGSAPHPPPGPRHPGTWGPSR